ncbi:e092cfa1-a2c0-424c-9eb0-e4bf7d7da31f [Sclerotinia trifoliorum]|uniref:E092cfa1-a2c0-424c-9eb0-e4bf7d7da31f n=1 Tax=Sclerotinia trifoliorum TaxID=28548 RepID=A0A8H2W0F3_9HELO|nr:e092cfa1-a2c0-424c-9eb0-e4bf7d7da31f [Sclerotinia trifoliorum]
MPAYRTGGRRQNRTGYVDHDILEGIPVRQWRREYVTVAPPPPQESNATQNDIWASELPWGMPKDSHLLPQHSQDLLRAARSGRIYKRPTPMDEEEQELEPTLGDKPDKKEDEIKDSGFTARAWKQIPGHQTASDMDFLAKRRKGLGSAVPQPASIPTVIQTTVRRTDAAGNEYLEKVIVPHGQVVVGDVVSQTTIPDPNVVEGTPFRRKGPVGKKGKRGPGRGRKKIVPTSTPNVTSEPSAQNGDASTSNLGADGMKIDGEGNTTPAKNLDTEMIDDSNPASDDDDGDEGDQADEDDDSVDVLNSPSRPHRDSSQDRNMPIMQDIPKLSSTDIAMGGTDNDGPTKSDLERVKDEGKFGSPLKQIALTTSTVNTPMVSPTETTLKEPNFFAAGNTDIPSAPIEKINQEMLSVAEVTAPIELPQIPPHPTKEHEEAFIELRAEEEEEEEMLLDILDRAEIAEIAQIGAAMPIKTESPTTVLSDPIQVSAKPSNSSPAEVKSPQNVAVPSSIPAVEEPPTVSTLATAFTDSSIREGQALASTSSASPAKVEEPPIASNSPPAAISEVVEPTEPSEPTGPTEPTEPPQPTEAIEPNEAAASPTGHTEAAKPIPPTNLIESDQPGVANESMELEMVNESNATDLANELNVPSGPIKPATEDDDDDFPDLLGGLERNLYGDLQSFIAPPESIVPEELAPSEPIKEDQAFPKEAGDDLITEEKEKGGEVKEETSTS